MIPHFTRALLLRSAAAWLSLRICMAGISVLAAALAERPPPGWRRASDRGRR